MKKRNIIVCLILVFAMSIGAFATVNAVSDDPLANVMKANEYVENNLTDKNIYNGYYSDKFGNEKYLIVRCVDEGKVRTALKDYEKFGAGKLICIPAQYSLAQMEYVYEKVEEKVDEFVKLHPEYTNKNKSNPLPFGYNGHTISYVIHNDADLIGITVNGNLDNSEFIDYWKNFEHRNLITIKVMFPTINP